MRKQWYTSKWAVIAFHALPWLLIFILPALGPNRDHGKTVDWQQAVFNTGHVGLFIASLALFYLNAFLFIPFYLYKNRTWPYVALILVSVLAFCVWSYYLFDPDRNRPFVFHWRELWPTIFCFFLWIISTFYRLASDKVRTDQVLKEKENENLKTELSFLRSQVSPHFLFNVLNNMVAMARLKSEKLEPSLIKLSGLMRYMLYESDEDKVPLSREIEYVHSYIDLQKLRFGKEMQVQVEMSAGELAYLIEPMLLIPFIENAFKHGAGMIDQPEIDISLDVHGGLLNFQVRNKYLGETTETKDKTSGIGLGNVVRRLDLLYPKKHILTLDKSGGWFTASLQIKLQ
jgi:two-component system, LytTR family, sensor kinase